MATTPSNLPAEQEPTSSVPVGKPPVSPPAHHINGKPPALPAARTGAAADASPLTPHASPLTPTTAAAWVRMAPSWLASMIFHIIVLLVMAVWIDEIRNDSRVAITASASERVDLEELTSEDIQPLDVTALDSSEMPQSAEDIVFAPSESFSESLTDELAANTAIELNLDSGELVGPSVLTQSISQGLGESLSGIRAGPNKSEAIRKGGGNAASEAAVAAALKWLASQQMSDGGWTFDLRRTPNPNKNPGEPQVEDARNAATALALLPFLGAGHTPKEGRYAPVVRKGLLFLSRSAKPENTRFGPGASWVDPGRGVMYSHGMASIAVCEAYAMTKDKSLLPYAQASVNLIAAAQCADGGWRYQPNDPTGGDTSVVGWQLMALKSASMGYHLEVPRQTLIRAYAFLDRVQIDDGAAYRYMIGRPQQSSATTAIGLLCRMYLGWKKERPGLQRGVEQLSKRGPSTGKQADMYYNYYATQVMRHWEGEEWEKWNEVMRDFLIESQAKKGAETGSWHFDENHGNIGGRLYTTSMATMTLEVYYRHLPLYQKSSTEAEFKP
ncbi:MAG: hypothetical protein WD894_20360 [Pirellulales bacterium]